MGIILYPRTAHAAAPADDPTTHLKLPWTRTIKWDNVLDITTMPGTDWAADHKYRINDGEGLMHENHCNAHIKDSRLVNNRGNAYLSLYKTGGILIKGDPASNNVVKGNVNSGPAAPLRNQANATLQDNTGYQVQS
ncbi:MAG TPA: hypothetical protein ENN81_06525 [Phycisphaerales bacterium]|nr:hypothetical protein [Phycisphaerales bacterium]